MTEQLTLLLTKTKAQLVEEAVSLLMKHHRGVLFNKTEYRTRAWYSSFDVKVNFERLIYCTEPRTNRVFDITVSLINGYIDPFDGPYSEQFYIPAEADQKIIELAKQSTGISNGKYTDAFYRAEVSVDNDVMRVFIHTDASFRIIYLDKITGAQVMSPLEGSYVIHTPAITDSEPVWVEVH